MATQPDAAAMQEAIDKVAIGELQSRYMFALDWRDPEVYASVFTDDAILEWPEGRSEGKAAIREACVRIGAYFDNLANAAGPNVKPFKLRHFVTNRVIDVRGDRARAWAYWLDLNNDNLPRYPYIPAYGYYEDDLVRTAGGWLFTHRKVFNEMTGGSPREIPLRD